VLLGPGVEPSETMKEALTPDRASELRTDNSGDGSSRLPIAAAMGFNIPSTFSRSLPTSAVVDLSFPTRRPARVRMPTNASFNDDCARLNQRGRRRFQYLWRIRHPSATNCGNPPRKNGTYTGCRFRDCSADGNLSTWAFAEFRSKWRMRTQFSTLRGGS